MIPMVNTDGLGAFTINTTINAKAIIQAVNLSFRFFIVVWGVLIISTNINKKTNISVGFDILF